MILLLLSIAALLLGPLIARLFQGKPAVNQFLDGFILVTIGGIAFSQLLPEAVMQIGIMAIVMVILGLLLPYYAERSFHDHERATHGGVLVLAFSGILVHTLLDGMALSQASFEHSYGKALAYAVVLHRLPVGLLIWWALRPLYRKRIILATLAVMIFSTIIGFMAGNTGLNLEHSSSLTYFQALVTGSLLHVLFHRHFHGAHRHGSEIDSHYGGGAKAAAMGAVAGAILLVLLPLGQSLPDDHSIHNTAGLALTLFFKSAPALLLGFIIAAGIQNFIPEAGLSWLKSKNRSGRVTRGMLFGLPLPICSCGVVPLYHGLVRRGVSVGAATAFLIATPELGIDALLISVPLLGWKMSLVRLLAAALIAWAAAYIMDLLLNESSPPEKSITVEPLFVDTLGSPVSRFWNTLNHELIDHLGPWVLVGLIIAAIADPFLAQINWQGFPAGLDIVLMAIVGMPLYVCATGATPIAAIMLLNGISPGAVLAFLITGPATNITTLGVMRSLHGTRTAIIFPLVIIGLTIIVGLVVNVSVGEIPRVIESHEALEKLNWLNWGAGGILLLLFLGSLFRIGPRGMLENLYEGLGTAEEEDAHYNCEH